MKSDFVWFSAESKWMVSMNNQKFTYFKDVSNRQGKLTTACLSEVCKHDEGSEHKKVHHHFVSSFVNSNLTHKNQKSYSFGRLRRIKWTVWYYLKLYTLQVERLKCSLLEKHVGEYPIPNYHECCPVWMGFFPFAGPQLISNWNMYQNNCCRKQLQWTWNLQHLDIPWLFLKADSYGMFAFCALRQSHGCRQNVTRCPMCRLAPNKKLLGVDPWCKNDSQWDFLPLLSPLPQPQFCVMAPQGWLRLGWPH